MAEQWWWVVVRTAGEFANTAQREWPSDGRVQHRHRQVTGGRAGKARRVGSRTVRRWVTFLLTTANDAIIHRPSRRTPFPSVCLFRSFWLTPCYIETDSPRSPRLLIKSITPYGRCHLRFLRKKIEIFSLFFIPTFRHHFFLYKLIKVN